MVGRLYVARGPRTIGPFSAAQLQKLAASGQLRLTDVIWREGMQKSFLAANVRDLFPPTNAQTTPPAVPGPEVNEPPSSPPVPAAADESDSSAGPTEVPGTPDELTLALLKADRAALAPLEPSATPGATDQSSQTRAIPKEKPTAPTPEPPRKRLAVAVKGAILLGQDGGSVHFRKKCVQCGFEDRCRSTLRIGQGLNRVHFFCPKCRKNREVLIRGSIH
jgi:hypothetical protein